MKIFIKKDIKILIQPQIIGCDYFKAKLYLFIIKDIKDFLYLVCIDLWIYFDINFLWHFV